MVLLRIGVRVAAGISAADFRFEMDCERCSVVLVWIGSGSGRHTEGAGKGVSFSGGVGVACSCTLTGPETSTDAQGASAPGLIALASMEPKIPAGRLTTESPPLASFNAATISAAFCLVLSNAIFAHVSFSTH